MTLNGYQAAAKETAQYPVIGQGITYPALGLAGEAGEVADKVKKIFRDKGGVVSDRDRIEIAKEIGDVLWYCAAMAEEIGISLQDICSMNIAKLADRKERGVMGGEGDNR